MRRLAWFTPLAPVRSGISAYSAELVPELARRHAIDLFVDARQVPVDGPAPGSAGPMAPGGGRVRVRPSHEFPWRQVRDPYDLVVYQMGNSSCHDFMWGYLAHHPGLVILHDGQLHQARARALISCGQLDEYRAEVAWSHPGAPPELADLVISASAGSLYDLWPHVAIPVLSARMVAVHNAGLAAALADRFPTSRIETIRMGVADPLAPGTGWQVRQRHRIRPDAILLAAFGAVTPEKRISQILRAFAPVARERPQVRLLLVGEKAGHYDVAAEAASLGLADRVVVAGFVADADLPAYLDASDLCLCLRWPTSRETSASWLRCIGAGRATLISDLVHLTEVPAVDPRDWRHRPSLPAPGGAADADQEPCAVAIDMADEVRSIGLALARLVDDAELRRSLGRAARRRWARDHTLAAMAADYNRVIERAAAAAPPDRAGFPPHLVADGTGWARQVASPFGVALFDGAGHTP